MSLAGKTIVVTGAASGIGQASSKELKRQGATVIGVDRNPVEDLDDWKKTDLAEPGLIDALVDELPAGISGLANIAGLPPTAPAEAVLRVNVKGLQRLTLGLIPKLADGASIVNLASLAGNGWRDAVDQIKEFESTDWDGITEFVAKHNMEANARSYFFSKEVVRVWTMLRRWTWRDRGIRMNAVSPGPVETPILPDFLATLGERAAHHMAIMDRLGRPEDVAPVVAFLMSDESAWMRGANLSVDGGLYANMLVRDYGLEG